MEFAFHYEGPIEAKMQPGCIWCIAAAGMAPPHECRPGCSVCEAGKSKTCQGHRGLGAAIEGASVPEEVEPLFDHALQTVGLALAGASGHCRVKVFGQEGAPDAPPRTLTVEVTLLK
jgi:hypothetical protein